MFRLKIGKNRLDARMRYLAREGQIAKIKRIPRFVDPLDLTTYDSDTTVLNLAAKYNQINVIEFLLEAGYDINGPSSDGTTPLLTAALCNNFVVVKFLLGVDANLFACNAAGQSPLQLLINKIKYLPVSVTQLLLKRFSSSFVQPEDMVKVLLKFDNSLRFALMLKNADVMRLMLNETEEVSIVRAHELLLAAMDLNYMENVKVLLHNGHKAAYRRGIFFQTIIQLINGSPLQLESAKPFLKELVHWNIIDEHFVQSLIDVFANSEKPVLELLLECEIHTLVKSLFKRNLLVHIFRNHSKNVMELFQDRDFDVNGRDKNGETALHVAVRHNSPKRIKMLLSRGANPNIKDRSGKSPLLLARESECIEPLLKAGADVQVIDYTDFCVFDISKELTMWMELLLAHLAIIQGQGVPIRRVIYNRINSKVPFKRFYDNCRTQIDWLKGQVIQDDLTLFKALVMKPEEFNNYQLDKLIVNDILNRARDYHLYILYEATLEIHLLTHLFPHLCHA